ncbi:MAG TPA: hypothetical protein VK536_07275 [Candidatus Limnocylindrales bacterium]|nr:hypothetical protein [Candidatus Limnocylindrales bacterium]
MKTLKNKIAAIVISMLMITVIGASAALTSNAHAQTLSIPTYSYVNVAPNPCGVGQTVTINFWLSVPLVDIEDAVNITVVVTGPSGTTTLGPFRSDLTGGSFTTYTPTAVGNYTFQMIYGGQRMTVFPYIGDLNAPSVSAVQTLIVQSTPATGFPTTPLPTSWWQTPVNAENVQQWAAISGGWFGYYANTFAITGGYNDTGNYNPYTTAPASAHILWTKPFCVGGVVGGTLGNDEANSNYWTTSQYDPKYAPVIIDGIEYTTWYTTQTGSQQGIMAINLYNGQTMWVINTTAPLRCGMIINFKTPDQYGNVGPYIFTQGFYGMFAPPGPWSMYDGLTGQYLATIINTPSFVLLGADSDGNIIGYTVNTNSTLFGPSYPTLTVQLPIVTGLGLTGYESETFNTVNNGPVMEMYNLTQAFIASGLMSALGGLFDWTIPIGSVFNWDNGLQWAVSQNAKLNGVVQQGLGTSTFSYDGWSGNTIVFEEGFVNTVGETAGWVVEAGFNANTGAFEWIANRTGSPYEPYTRMTNNLDGAVADGVYVDINQATYQMAAYYLSTGDLAWTNTLNVKMSDGHFPDQYDEFDFETTPDATTGVLYVWGLGGDVWAVNMTNGDIIWSWSTAQINGPAGTETPYGIYPLWTFSDEALAGQGSGTILYLSEGHEYNPPLFHGALELALNATTGKLVWSNLGFDDTATAVAYGIMTTFNAYDGQIYAYGQGPSKTTVTAPDVGVTTATPITITGTVTDISAGASQEAVAANFPNGLPCVSDASMTQFMEAVYEQQTMATNLTGVPVTVSVTDSNGNHYNIGTAISDPYTGTFGLTWTPIITGNYTVTASFAGTAAYYGSSSTTYFYAGSPPATPAPTASPPSGLASTGTVELGVAAIIIVIIICVAILAVLMARKRP